MKSSPKKWALYMRIRLLCRRPSKHRAAPKHARTHARMPERAHEVQSAHYSHMPPPSSQAKLSSNQQSITLTGVTEDSLVPDVADEELGRGGLDDEPFITRRGKSNT